MDHPRTITVTQEVEITLKEEAFTDEFMSEFRKLMYNFNTVDEHARHIAELYATGIYDPMHWRYHFIEGYGQMLNFISDMKIQVYGD